MQLAYINCDGGVPPIGHKGCSIHVQEVIHALISLGHKIDLYSVRCEQTDPGLNRVFPIHRRKQPSEDERLFCAQLNAQLYKKLRIRENGPQAQLFYERYSLWSYQAMEFAKTNRIPCVLEVNSPLVEEQKHHRTLKDEGLAGDIARRVFTLADIIVVVSQNVAEYVEKFPGTAEKIKLIPNGINQDRFPAPKTHDPRKSPVVIGFLGTLKKWHGLDQLLYTVRKLLDDGFDFRLLIIGDGPERSRVENRISDLGLGPLCEITGALYHAEALKKLLEIDIAVAPYPELNDFYFSPLKLFEYMAAGLAIVCSDMGDNDQIIDHKSNGLLYPAGDQEAMCQCIRDLLQHPHLRRKYGESARRKALATCTWKNKLIELLRDPRIRLERLDHV